MCTTVGAVLLAAGNSTRMNEIGQLLPIHGKAAAAYCIENMIKGGIEDIVAVLGHERWQVAAALSGYRICMAVNDDPGSDMDRSAAIGLAVMPGYATGVIMSPCDHPLVSADTYAELVQLHHRLPHKIIIPAFEGRIGQPVLFPVDLGAPVSEGTSLNRIISGHHEKIFHLATEDPGVVHAMDSPAGYDRILHLSGAMGREMQDPERPWY